MHNATCGRIYDWWNENGRIPEDTPADCAARERRGQLPPESVFAVTGKRSNEQNLIPERKDVIPSTDI